MDHKSHEEHQEHSHQPETNGNGGGLAGVERKYVGHYDSIEGYAAAFAERAGLMDRVEPQWLKAWLQVDLTALARDLSVGLMVVSDPNGGIHVFDIGI